MSVFSKFICLVLTVVMPLNSFAGQDELTTAVVQITEVLADVPAVGIPPEGECKLGETKLIKGCGGVLSGAELDGFSSQLNNINFLRTQNIDQFVNEEIARQEEQEDRKFGQNEREARKKDLLGVIYAKTQGQVSEAATRARCAVLINLKTDKDCASNDKENLEKQAAALKPHMDLLRKFGFDFDGSEKDFNKIAKPKKGLNLEDLKKLKPREHDEFIEAMEQFYPKPVVALLLDPKRTEAVEWAGNVITPPNRFANEPEAIGSIRIIKKEEYENSSLSMVKIFKSSIEDGIKTINEDYTYENGVRVSNRPGGVTGFFSKIGKNIATSATYLTPGVKTYRDEGVRHAIDDAIDSVSGSISAANQMIKELQKLGYNKAAIKEYQKAIAGVNEVNTKAQIDFQSKVTKAIWSFPAAAVIPALMFAGPAIAASLGAESVTGAVIGKASTMAVTFTAWAAGTSIALTAVKTGIDAAHGNGMSDLGCAFMNQVYEKGQATGALHNMAIAAAIPFAMAAAVPIVSVGTAAVWGGTLSASAMTAFKAIEVGTALGFSATMGVQAVNAGLQCFDSDKRVNLSVAALKGEENLIQISEKSYDVNGGAESTKEISQERWSACVDMAVDGAFAAMGGWQAYKSGKNLITQKEVKAEFEKRHFGQKPKRGQLMELATEMELARFKIWSEQNRAKSNLAIDEAVTKGIKAVKEAAADALGVVRIKEPVGPIPETAHGAKLELASTPSTTITVPELAVRSTPVVELTPAPKFEVVPSKGPAAKPTTLAEAELLKGGFKPVETRLTANSPKELLAQEAAVRAKAQARRAHAEKLAQESVKLEREKLALDKEYERVKKIEVMAAKNKKIIQELPAQEKLNEIVAKKSKGKKLTPAEEKSYNEKFEKWKTEVQRSKSSNEKQNENLFETYVKNRTKRMISDHIELEARLKEELVQLEKLGRDTDAYYAKDKKLQEMEREQAGLSQEHTRATKEFHEKYEEILRQRMAATKSKAKATDTLPGEIDRIRNEQARLANERKIEEARVKKEEADKIRAEEDKKRIRKAFEKAKNLTLKVLEEVAKASNLTLAVDTIRDRFFTPNSPAAKQENGSPASGSTRPDGFASPPEDPDSDKTPPAAIGPSPVTAASVSNAALASTVASGSTAVSASSPLVAEQTAQQQCEERTNFTWKNDECVCKENFELSQEACEPMDTAKKEDEGSNRDDFFYNKMYGPQIPGPRFNPTRLPPSPVHWSSGFA